MKATSAAQSILNQIANTIHQISDEDYVKPIDILNNASLGQHIRHVLEFFLCLMDGYQVEKVNYDQRKHDQSIAENRSLALEKAREIVCFIEQADPNTQLTLEVTYGIQQGKDPQLVKTNFLRELVYNLEHAIHHMAIIRIGIKAICPQLSLDEDFGVASSTLRFRNV